MLDNQLDENFQKKSYAKMTELMGGGTTVLYVSHSVGSIMKLCDRCVWLDHGHVREIGPAEDVCCDYVDFVTPGEGARLREQRAEERRREAEKKDKEKEENA